MPYLKITRIYAPPPMLESMERVDQIFLDVYENLYYSRSKNTSIGILTSYKVYEALDNKYIKVRILKEDLGKCEIYLENKFGTGYKRLIVSKSNIVTSLPDKE